MEIQSAKRFLAMFLLLIISVFLLGYLTGCQHQNHPAYNEGDCRATAYDWGNETPNEWRCEWQSRTYLCRTHEYAVNCRRIANPQPESH